MDDFDFLYTDASPREYARQPFIPPPEPFRPPIPYKKGLKLTIHRHIPSMPFGGRHVGHRDSVPKDALLTATAVDQCLAYPPLEGETCLEEPSRTLEIVGELRVGDEARAQVVLCHLDDDDKEQIVVGKIYDPLYYSRRDEDFPFIVPDITYEADHDYLLEAAAYTELEDSQLGGTMIPTYYGSWTFNIDVKLPTETKTRPVRMILMEHIRGPCMKHMDPEKLSQEQKLEIVARVFEANSRITSAGVQQNDNEERNVVVQVGDVEGGLKSAIERVVVLDFNIAVIPRLSKATVPHSFELPEDDSDVEQDEPEEYTSTLPESPVDFGWGAWAIFEDWLPDDWMDPSKDRAMRLYRTWLLETWGNSEQFARPERCFQDIEENEEYLRGKGIRWEYDQGEYTKLRMCSYRRRNLTRIQFLEQRLLGGWRSNLPTAVKMMSTPSTLTTMGTKLRTPPTLILSCTSSHRPWVHRRWLSRDMDEYPVHRPDGLM